jgi:hypothetical protein
MGRFFVQQIPPGASVESSACGRLELCDLAVKRGIQIDHKIASAKWDAKAET